MQAVYCRAADGSEPLEEFIEGLSDPEKQLCSTVRSSA